MYPFRPTKQEGLDRMTTLVRQIGEEQEKQQHQQHQEDQEDQHDESSILSGDSQYASVIDLSFYQIKDNNVGDDEEEENGNIPILDQFLTSNHDDNRLSQCTSLNLSYNYLVDPFLFVMAKYDDLLLKQMTNLKELNLSHNDFKNMPFERLKSFTKSLEKLDLSYNRLKSFALNTTDHETEEQIVEHTFDQLNWLNMAHNTSLVALPRNLAQLIPNIVELNLSFASLTNDAMRGLFVGSKSDSTTTNAIVALEHLRVLNLSHNKLSGDNFPAAIEDNSAAECFIAFPSLEELYLEENQIVSLNDQWLLSQGANFGSTLKICSLSFNKLQVLNTCFFNENIFEQLQKLHVNNNMIESVPFVVKHDNGEHVSQMMELRLGNNQITEIRDGELFAKWNQLTAITLQNNKLTRLPDDVGCLKHIEDLYLFGNDLVNLPETIGDLAQLQELDLYNNQLQTLPAQVGRLVALKRLNLDNNQLQTLPNDIVNLTQLQIFTFRDNPQLQISPFLMMMRTDK